MGNALRLLAFICFLLTACAPEPASITFDGSKAAVTVHTRDRVPLKRAVVLDVDGKALDPQPLVAWSVDHDNVVALDGGALTPVGDGVARIEASVGQVKANYTLTVELADEMPLVERSTYNRCPVTDYGNGVYLFRCSSPSVQTSDFANALSDFVKDHRTLEVTTVSAMPKPGSEYNHLDGYLVITRPL